MKKSFLQRFIITCNPWFLASTLLLILGVYLVHFDPKLLGKDILQLKISFTSLQAYEVLCLGVLFLFRRKKLYYDSIFLVAIISILVFFPFITFNHALQFDENNLERIGLVAMLLAIAKFVSIKKFFKGINLPSLVLFSGLVMLVMNFSIPLVMRGLNVEDDISGTLFVRDVFSVLMPIVGFLGYMSMYQVKDGKTVYERKWLPITIFQCLYTVTLINIMSVMYVYDIGQSSFYPAVTACITAFLSIHPVIGLNKKIRSAILWGVLILGVLFLGNDHQIHFMILLSIIFMFSISLNDSWLMRFAIVFFALSYVETLSFVDMNYLQMCLISFVLVLSWSASFKENWPATILAAIGLMLTVLSYNVQEFFLVLLWPLSLILFLSTIWSKEDVKVNNWNHSFFSVLWLVNAIPAHLNGYWQHTFLTAAVLFGIQVIRWFYMNEKDISLPRILMGVGLLLWPIEKLVILLKEQSLSILVILLSFVVFIAGTLVTYFKRAR